MILLIWFRDTGVSVCNVDAKGLPHNTIYDAKRRQWVKDMCCIEYLKIMLYACPMTCLSSKNIAHVHQNLYRQIFAEILVCWGWKLGTSKLSVSVLTVIFPLAALKIKIIWLSFSSFFMLNCCLRPLCTRYRKHSGGIVEAAGLSCDVRW